MTDVLIPEGTAAQAQEAAVPALETKQVLWRERSWQVRPKPGARFLAAYEDDKIMTALKTVLGEKQYAEMLELDVDVEGDDGIEGFIKACERAWGMNQGN